MSREAGVLFPAGIAEATRSAYEKDWSDFVAWCGRSGRSALPASTETAVMYAKYLAEDLGKAPSSVGRFRAAIRAVHLAAGEQPPRALAITKVIREHHERLTQTKDPAIGATMSSPATKAAIASMLTHVDQETSAGLRDAALILLAFTISGRRTELALLDIEDIDRLSDGIRVRVRARRNSRRDLVITRSEDERLCPVVAVLAWLECLTRHGRSNGPLFVRINQHGQIAPSIVRGGRPIGDQSGRMTAQAISQVITRKAEEASLPGRWSSGSLRRASAAEVVAGPHDHVRVGGVDHWTDGGMTVVYGSSDTTPGDG